MSQAAESAPPPMESGASPPEAAAAAKSRPGGSWELLRLATPLIVSQSFMTVQIFVDTVLLSWHDPREMTASLPAMMWFWLFFGFLQVTAGYTSTFVAQYTGAGRPERVGPAVWQGIYFAVVSGFAFMLLAPSAQFLIALGGHSEALQPLEVAYLQCLAFAGLPMMVLAAVNGFFSGRGQTWVVLGIEASGTAVNVLLALLLIFGRGGFPEMGIAGAGWATVAGSWASALLALALLLGPRYRTEFATASGWRLDRDLFRRLLRYGGPAGSQMFLDALVWHFFTQLIGKLGDAEMGATTLAIRLTMFAFLPMLGMGQAICILVGQRLGGDRPDLAEKSAYTGLCWSFGYMVLVAALFVTMPQTLVALFESDSDPKLFAEVAAIVPTLLLCVAAFSLADSINISFAFALRGAGDTWFVTLLTFTLAWPILIVPTLLVVWIGGSVYWAWVFATTHIFATAVCFFLRFRAGKWKTMRVIEAAPIAETA